jgi:GAF domain-containing protein
LSLEDADGREVWTDDEIGLVEEVSEQVALALENARLFEEAQIRADEMGILNELARSLSTQLNLEGVLDEAYQGTQRLLGASSFYVALYDRENERISFPLYVEEGEQVRRASRSMGDGLTEHVIRSQESMLLKYNPLERSREMGIEMKGRPPDSWLGVPLVVGERVLGVMAVQSYAASEHYDEHDRELLNAIASQTAIALQNVYLFEETQRRARRERLVREVTAKIVRSTDLDTVLETTAQELGKVLGVPRTVVRLKTSESDNEEQTGGGEE